MRVFRGRSFETDAKKAVKEATQDWQVEETSLDLVLVFASTKQNPDEVAKAAQDQFPGIQVVGCTSSGERYQGEASSGALVMAGLSTPSIQWTCAVAKNISTRNKSSITDTMDKLFARAKIDKESFDASQHFCLMFVDGLHYAEEWLSATVTEALDGIPLVGGSAGDDLALKDTKVFLDGRAHSDAAVFLLGRSPARDFTLFKHQHFLATPQRLVTTRCDRAQRRIYEFNGYPAVEALARTLGIDQDELTQEYLFLHPLTVTIDDELYIRSIISREEDGSLTIGTAVEEGMVLHLSTQREMCASLEQDLKKLKPSGNKRKFLLPLNCALRQIESSQRGVDDSIKDIINEIAESSVGFNTYGEQFNGLHINHTMVGIAIG